RDLRDLRSLGFDETVALAVALGAPRFRGEQIWRWVHGRMVDSIDEMTNVPRELRARLAEVATIGALAVAEVQTWREGTRKLRLVPSEGKPIERVTTPDGDKTTQCISSQVGCAIDCQFCATAKLGLSRNLEPGEIVDQVYRAKKLLAE